MVLCEGRGCMVDGCVRGQGVHGRWLCARAGGAWSMVVCEGRGCMVDGCVRGQGVHGRWLAI